MNPSLEEQHGGEEPSSQPSAPDERALWDRFQAAATSEEILATWLEVQCQRIDGVLAGVLLTHNPNTGAAEPASVWPEGQRPGRHLGRAAERALQEGRPLALQLDPQAAGNSGANSHTLIAQPVDVRGQPAGVAVLDLEPRGSVEVERALRSLGWGISWVELALQRETAGLGQRDQVTALLDLIATPLEHEHFRAAATAFVTQFATQFDCDRVSLGFVEKGSCQLSAVSHAAQFGERANLSRSVEAAMDEALDQEAPVLWPTAADGTPQVSRFHEELAKQSGADTIASIPIAHGVSFCAVVVLERSGSRHRAFSGSELQLIETAAALAGPMLEIQRRDDRWLGRKASDSLRQTLADLVGPKHLGLKIAAAALAATSLFALLANGEFRVTADSVLEARVLRAAVAPYDGYVYEAPARAGDRVRAGDLLAQLDDREQRLERARWSSQVAQLTKQYRQAMAAGRAANLKILAAQTEQAQAQLDLVDSNLARMRLLAPFDGIVVTGDLSQKLGSPVQRGDLLFEVAPLDEYRVVLRVDERDIDEIVVDQAGEVRFASFPDQSIGFKIAKITPVSLAMEGQNTFRVEARLESTLAGLRPGLEGVAKINVDRRRLLWIWTHDLLDWLRLNLWTWAP